MMRWIALLLAGEKPRNRSLLFGGGTLLEVEWRIRRALWTLPVTHADVEMAGEPIEYYHRWLEHTAPDDPVWQEALAGVEHARVDAPVHLTGGWYDFFLRGLLQDYAQLKAAGKQPYLTVGGWHHFSSFLSSGTSLPDAFAWFERHLKGNGDRLREMPVRLYVMGANEWREYPDYPPPSTGTRYYLAGYQRLADQPDDSAPDTYCYDPANPTPVVGGTQFHLLAGAWNNHRLERRRDVLVYTSPILTQPLEIIGAVRLELFVRSSLEYTDFYGRLCDVQPDGKSINLCDGLFRVVPGKGECQPDGTLKIEVDLWATAYQFKPGHALRLIVASGAHPRWSRNTGSANPLRDTELRSANQTIYHDAAHPSALVLPVTRG
jgi:putative CocE/NonD family hydrolase